MPRKRLRNPDVMPRSRNISSIQGCVCRSLSNWYPKNSPTAMEEGSMRPNELSSAALRHLG